MSRFEVVGGCAWAVRLGESKRRTDGLLNERVEASEAGLGRAEPRLVHGPDRPGSGQVRGRRRL